MSDTHSPPHPPGRSATFPRGRDPSPASPRAITFAATASTSPSRPTTSPGRKSLDAIGHPRQGSTSLIRANTEPVTFAEHWTDSWTDVHEERLILVQAELKKAQKRWSESQEIWLEEEIELLAMKRNHQKAAKNREESAKKVAKVWKAKTWKVGSLKSKRKGSSSSATGISQGEAVTDDEEEDITIERTDTGSTLSKAIRRLSLSVRSSRKGSMSNTPQGLSESVSRDESPVR